VVTDSGVKARVAEWYRESWDHFYGSRREDLLHAPPSNVGLSPSAYRAVEYLARHIEEAPVWVVPVLREAASSTNPRLGASIYGAVQQPLLAARAYGVGGVVTTFHVAPEEMRNLLDLPNDAMTMALVPLGYPERGRWSQPRRQPVDQVVHWDLWGNTRDRG
jgi:nitroreductase